MEYDEWNLLADKPGFDVPRGDKLFIKGAWATKHACVIGGKNVRSFAR